MYSWSWYWFRPGSLFRYFWRWVAEWVFRSLPSRHNSKGWTLWQLALALEWDCLYLTFIIKNYYPLFIIFIIYAITTQFSKIRIEKNTPTGGSWSSKQRPLTFSASFQEQLAFFFCQLDARCERNQSRAEIFLGKEPRGSPGNVWGSVEHSSFLHSRQLSVQ